MIDFRRKVREEVETEGIDCSDRFPAWMTIQSNGRWLPHLRVHPICAPGSSSAHIIDVTSVYPK
jgi:hypothetical protein